MDPELSRLTMNNSALHISMKVSYLVDGNNSFLYYMAKKKSKKNKWTI